MATHGRSEITIFVEVTAVLTFGLALLAYIENRAHKKLSIEIAELDKELKSLQLKNEKGL